MKMRKEIEKIVQENYLVGDAKVAVHKILMFLIEKVIMNDANKPEHWDDWTIERQEGYVLALRYLKQMILN